MGKLIAILDKKNKIVHKLIAIFDNGGETVDRYTIIIKEKNCKHKKPYVVYGASNNPFHPLGFGQYCGEITRKQVIMFKLSKSKDNKIGKRIFRKDVKSQELKQYINQNLK